MCIHIFNVGEICRKHLDRQSSLKIHNHKLAHGTQWLSNSNMCHQNFINIYFLSGAHTVLECIKSDLNDTMLHELWNESKVLNSVYVK